MSATTNAQRIEAGYRAFNAGDGEVLVDLFAEDIVWHYPGASEHAGEHVGRDATLAFLAALGARTGGTYRAELIDVMASDDHAAGWARDRAERAGRTLDVNAVVTFRMVDAKVAEAWHHFDDVGRVDAFWA
jgi:ketosteroid isomerase-like protein